MLLDDGYTADLDQNPTTGSHFASLPSLFLYQCRTFEQTINFIEKVATTKIHEDIANLIAELGIQLRELELERKEDHKIVKLHPFEVASLANLIKAVSTLSCYLLDTIQSD